MTTEQQQVREFMQLFGQETPARPTIPSLEVRKLRARLILEEALELIVKGLGIDIEVKIPKNHMGWFNIGELEMEKFDLQPNGIENLIELADGIADSNVVTLGCACSAGLDMEPIFAEVHRSNMSKMWSVYEYNSYMEDKLDSYDKEIDYTFEFKWWSLAEHESPMGEDRCWLVKNKDGKVIKSPSYSPANIQAEINKQLNQTS